MSNSKRRWLIQCILGCSMGAGPDLIWSWSAAGLVRCRELRKEHSLSSARHRGRLPPGYCSLLRPSVCCSGRGNLPFLRHVRNLPVVISCVHPRDVCRLQELFSSAKLMYLGLMKKLLSSSTVRIGSLAMVFTNEL